MAKRKRTITVEHRSIGPTPERLAKAEQFFTVGDDQTRGKVYTLQDSTLERLYSRLLKDKGLTRSDEDSLRREYTALQRYKHHWYHGGLVPTLSSVDPNQVFAPDPLVMSGMARSEAQAHHRSQWREARAALGHRAGIVVDNVVCSENTLEIAGYAVGWQSKPQAISAAIECLRDSGERLAKMWGIG